MSKAPYYLVVGKHNEGKAEFLRDCLSADIGGAELEAIAEFERLRVENPDIMVRVVDSSTRIVERAINQNNIANIKMSKQEEAYVAPVADEVLLTSMLVAQLGMEMLQAHVDGKMDLDTYNKLYDTLSKADVQARKVHRLLEERD